MKMSLIYSGKSLDECLDNASKELNLLKEEIKYKIIKEKHSLISKKFEIQVEEFQLDSSNFKSSFKGDIKTNNKEHNSILDNQLIRSSVENGAKVESGKIIVTDNDLGEITIKSCDNIKLYINGELCNEKRAYKVTQFDKISYKGVKTEASKNVKITISKDKMEAYICIEYIPEYIYKLKDKPNLMNLALKAMKIQGELPVKYTVTEIKEILRQNKVTEGIIYKSLIEACAAGINENVLIAKGVPAIDDIPSEIKILFDLGEKKIIDESSNEKIDYRNLYSISNIEEGQVLAEIIPGETGQDGKNVIGEILKRKIIKSKPIRIGEGCRIEGNNIIATRTGRPSSKNGVLSVNNIYKIKDVDMKSGNINFIGDVNIIGNVKENMTVKSGNSLYIEKSVDISKIIAGGEINIKGNAINSTILTGQIDMEKKMYLEQLNEYKENIIQLINAVEKLNESSNSTKKISELVKILIENRYKNIPKLSLGIITHSICNDSEKSELVEFIRSKIMGLNISKIESIRDLNKFKELIENEIDFLEDDMIIHADIYVGYCQDCLVKSTGNIIITGKGQYVSNLIALKDIVFMREDSVARGGVLSARGNIKLGLVGSPSGVVTKLEVLPTGIITAKVAYNNTVFYFGKKSKILDVSGKNVKAYMDRDGEIIIEKFVL
ncbi:hypothetical protein CLCHR_46360 [Clostridium chromiireducens]|uniref:RNA-binding protein KhpB N-terminal domain-containing protein n=2 Tax=Clostridium chromiireducens TaxID=225345 RepID=A0A1V4I6X3_9CLOT|nr:hypothetical protein CLCHR_46360 [Clostridium chromiireducens]